MCVHGGDGDGDGDGDDGDGSEDCDDKVKKEKKKKNLERVQGPRDFDIKGRAEIRDSGLRLTRLRDPMPHVAVWCDGIDWANRPGKERCRYMNRRVLRGLSTWNPQLQAVANEVLLFLKLVSYTAERRLNDSSKESYVSLKGPAL